MLTRIKAMQDLMHADNMHNNLQFALLVGLIDETFNFTDEFENRKFNRKFIFYHTLSNVKLEVHISDYNQDYDFENVPFDILKCGFSLNGAPMENYHVTGVTELLAFLYDKTCGLISGSAIGFEL